MSRNVGVITAYSAPSSHVAFVTRAIVRHMVIVGSPWPVSQFDTVLRLTPTSFASWV